MNAGAAIATGEHLLFLHADTRLPEGYRHEIQRVLFTVACGAFPLQIDAPGFAENDRIWCYVPIADVSNALWQPGLVF